MWANHIGQTLIGSLHQPNVEFQKTIYLAQWFIATAELPVAHVRTHVAEEFFSSFYSSFGARVFNAGCFSSWAGSSWILVAHSNVALT
jgi:hypothetical protein